MMYEKQFFCSRASQRETRESLPPPVIPISPDSVAIKLRLFKLNGFLSPPRTVLYDAPNLITEPQMVISLSRAKLSYPTKRGYAKLMARHLSKMGVPEAEHPAIIGKVFKVIQVAVPRVPITVSLVDVTVTVPDEASLCKLTGWVEVDRKEMLDVNGHILEFMESYRVDDVRRHYDAVRQGLKLVRLDRLEAAVRQTPCLVCKEELTNRVAQLHCSHCYHLGCISRWRTKSHLCPSCQHPMVDEPGKQYSQLQWFMRLASESVDDGDSLNQMIRSVISKINPDHIDSLNLKACRETN
ncbi:hypothetical protein ACLB2K_023389 [Fragaria x ananassa]